MYWKIKGLRVQTFLFSVICDRTSDRGMPIFRTGAIPTCRSAYEKRGESQLKTKWS
jgi:hypothetical protein